MTTFDLSSFTCIEMAVYDSSGANVTFGVLNGPTSYLIFTGSGFSDDIKMLKVYNASTVDFIISYDGVTRHDFWPSGATLIFDFQTNHADNASDGAGTLNGRKGQKIWGINSAGAGNLYIAGYR